MSDIIAMHRADLVEAVQEAVKPLKATIAALEARCRETTIERDTAHGAMKILAKRISDFECALRKIATVERWDVDISWACDIAKDALDPTASETQGEHG